MKLLEEKLNVVIVNAVEKELACGDSGYGAMASPESIFKMSILAQLKPLFEECKEDIKPLMAKFNEGLEPLFYEKPMGPDPSFDCYDSD